MKYPGSRAWIGLLAVVWLGVGCQPPAGGPARQPEPASRRLVRVEPPAVRPTPSATATQPARSSSGSAQRVEGTAPTPATQPAAKLVEPAPAPAVAERPKPARVAPTPTPAAAPKVVTDADRQAWRGPFTYAGEPSGGSLRRLKNEAYLVGYDEKRKNPAWVAYYLPAEVKFADQERPSRFDTDTRTKAKVRHDDYSGTGFDRGHMAPSYGIFSRFGPAAQEQTFLMSNIAPQTPNLNRGRWKQLETHESGHGQDGGWAADRQGIWITIGPLYDEDRPKLPAGIAQPSHFFRIVVDEDQSDGTWHILAFILPNDAKVDGDLAGYLTSVDDIEFRSGLDFLHDLPDEIEDPLEMAVPDQLWP